MNSPIERRERTFSELAREAKTRLLRMHFESGVGHIGGNLSALDLLLVLYHKVLSPDDLFVLSKGHSAGALYVTLWSMDRLTDNDLTLFHRDGTKLSGHPPANLIPEIKFATGSLGHGFSISAGLALGKRLRDEPGRVFCLMSDGEWNEGSSWEALIFAKHRRLEKLTVIVDCNGLQGFGSTKEVADLGFLQEKLLAFGVAAETIDGHDPEAIAHALSRDAAGPRAIIARTRKGCGVSFMENKMEWHYLPMSAEQYQQALDEIAKS